MNLLLALSLFLNSAEVTAVNGTTNRSVEAVYVETPPVIDGILDEACWHENQGFTDFYESWPVLCDSASEETRVVVLYDDKFLYMGFFCHYSEPDQVVAWLVPRESAGDGDDITVTLDTYDDDRNGFRFAFNPLGNQRDYYLSHGGSWQDNSWDGVWYVETSIDEYGWYAELAVPFKTLRFKPTEEQTWGLCVSRWLDNKYERVMWADYKPEDFGQGTMIERFGKLTGIRGVKPGLHMEFLPHLTQTVFMQNPFPDSAGFDDISFVPWDNGVIGLDYKYIVATNLTLDVTTFPDYGQIEADPENINLSQYETYFSERRPFFTEGSSIFGFPYFDLVYTRRIGKRLDDGTEVPIYAGGRFTGKLGGTEIGLLEVMTGQADYTDFYGQEQREPASLYSILRLTQDVLERSRIGFIGTSRDRIEGAYEADHVLGADADLHFDDHWGVYGSYARTLYADTLGTPDSFARKGGNMAALNLHRDGLLSYSVDVSYTDSLADVNAVGIMSDPGRTYFSMDLGYQNSWNDSWLRFLSTGVYPGIGKRLEDSLWSYSTYATASMTLANNWTVVGDGSAGYGYYWQDRRQRLSASAGLGFGSNSAKRFYGGVNLNYWDQYIHYYSTPMYFGHVVSLSPNFGLRIAKNFLVTGYASFRRVLYEDWRPDTLTYPDLMWTAGEGIRYTATRRLSFRLNAQQNTLDEYYGQQLLITWEIAPLSYLYLASSLDLEGDPGTLNPFDVHPGELTLYGKIVYLFRI
ncbi:carbohydrate binding family 9 domain-containing protein [candidate division WOR-3 bacterium]|nr:carbohydrate binding family 9 domain-containing protein [candidate division WOR-3 bacterium]